MSWKDTDIELWLSRIMRYGIVLASVVVIIGCVMFLNRHGSDQPKYAQFTGEPEQFRNVPGILSSLNSTDGMSMIEFGLVILISIPVLRVLFSVISFAAERDRVYVFITLGVLILLLFSLFGQQ